MLVLRLLKKKKGGGDKILIRFVIRGHHFKSICKLESRELLQKQQKKDHQEKDHHYKTDTFCSHSMWRSHVSCVLSFNTCY